MSKTSHTGGGTRAALVAVAALWSVGALAQTPAAPQDPKTTRLYKSKCTVCHGVDGKGNTDRGKKLSIQDLTDPAWQARSSDIELARQIRDGSKTALPSGDRNMPGFADELSEEQINALVRLVRGMKQAP